MKLIYKESDMSNHIIRWLKTIGKNIGWVEKESKKHPDISIWQKNDDDLIYQITVTENEEYSDILYLVKEAVEVIGFTLNISDEEAYREVILEGLILDDVLPFKNDNYEGLTLQWSSREGFGEYNIYRERDDENYIPYEADTEFMDDEDKRFLSELMRQFIEKIKITG